MKSNNLKQLHRYFSSFCSKNIEDLKEIFSDDVELVDWNNQYIGKDNVIKEVQSIFDTFESIQLNVIKIYNSIDIVEDKDSEFLLAIPSDSLFSCRIEIKFDGGDPLRIIDLIEFNNDAQIKNLTAYKR